MPLEVQRMIFEHLLPEDCPDSPWSSDPEYYSEGRPKEQTDHIMAIMRTNKHFYQIVKDMLYESPMGISVHEDGFKLYIRKKLVTGPSTNNNHALFFGKRIQGLEIEGLMIKITISDYPDADGEAYLQSRMATLAEVLHGCGSIGDLIIKFNSADAREKLH
jgi:hypothetical protein